MVGERPVVDTLRFCRGLRETFEQTRLKISAEAWWRSHPWRSHINDVLARQSDRFVDEAAAAVADEFQCASAAKRSWISSSRGRAEGKRRICAGTGLRQGPVNCVKKKWNVCSRADSPHPPPARGRASATEQPPTSTPSRRGAETLRRYLSLPLAGADATAARWYRGRYRRPDRGGWTGVSVQKALTKANVKLLNMEG